MELPVGISDFRELIDYRGLEGEPYLFLDKSLLIRDIIKESTKVILITRPRRFGKTLNMSMLRHFFCNQVDGQSTENLFNHLKIAEYKDCMNYQGKYPVIYLTFKDIKSKNFNAAYLKLCTLIARLYRDHIELLSSSKIPNREKAVFESILDEKASGSHLSSALKELSYYLYLHYGVKPLILIDEYDTPIQAGYMEGYYSDMIGFMREFLGEGLKDNSYLEKAVLTGILRVSKESLFSGLNNLETYSLLSSNYGQYFGFIEAEVEELLKKAGLSEELEGVRQWYNGYQCGGVVIYNPWSMISFVKHRQFKCYWVKTSGNDLVKELLIQSSVDFKAEFELLLRGGSVEALINEHMVFGDLAKDENNIWTLFLMTGYLKAKVIEEIGSNTLCHLQIPNKEVHDLYQEFIREWLLGTNNIPIFNKFLNDLLTGNIAGFEVHLRKIMMQIVSVHDVSQEQAETFYHALLLGLTFGVGEGYQLNSNKESGLGRFDILIKPRDPEKLGIILEIKSLPKAKGKRTLGEKLQKVALLAVKQIKEKHYHTLLAQEGMKRCLAIGIAFRGKEFAIAHSVEDLN